MDKDHEINKSSKMGVMNRVAKTRYYAFIFIYFISLTTYGQSVKNPLYHILNQNILPIDTSTNHYIDGAQLYEILVSLDTIETQHYDVDHIQLFDLVAHGYELYRVINEPSTTIRDTISNLTHYFKQNSDVDNDGEYLFSIPNYITVETEKIYDWNNRTWGRFKMVSIETSQTDNLLPGCFSNQTLILFEDGHYTSYYGSVFESCTAEHQEGYEKVYDYVPSDIIKHDPIGIGKYFIVKDKIYFFNSENEIIQRVEASFRNQHILLLQNERGTSFSLTWMKD